MTSRKNETDFFSKNSTNKREMTSSRKNETDFFFSKNSTNKREMTKRKCEKSGKYTKEAILKRKMNKIFDKFKKLYDKKEKNWYKKLANIHKPINEIKKDTIPNLPNSSNRKYVKSGKYTKEEISKRKIAKLVDKFKKISNEAETSLKVEKSWYEKLKKNILSQFFKQDPKFELDKKALNSTKRYVLDLKKYGLSLYDPLSLLEEVKPLVFEKFRLFPITKQQLTLQCKMKKINPATGETEIDKPHFHSYQRQIFKGSNFDEIFEKMKEEIILLFEKWISKGSQWQFHSGLKLILNINNIKLLKGSSWIPLPKKLRDKKAIINPKNEDQKCLLWCLAIYEILKTNPNFKNLQKIPKILKKKTEKFNLSGVNFPCDFSDVNKFENNNINISINVFGYNEKDGIFPIKISEKECDKHVNRKKW